MQLVTTGFTIGFFLGIFCTVYLFGLIKKKKIDQSKPSLHKMPRSYSEMNGDPTTAVVCQKCGTVYSYYDSPSLCTHCLHQVLDRYSARWNGLTWEEIK